MQPCLCLAFLIFADDQLVVTFKHIPWNLEVVWGRFVFVDPAGQVKGGAMAGAQKTAMPVIGQRGLGPGLKARTWRATQMRADADQHQDVLVDRTPFIERVIRGG